MSKQTQNQLLRRDYLLLRLDGQPGAKAKRALGITGRQFEEHLRASLERDASLADAPRSGRPPTYTPTILADCLDWFNHHGFQQLTKEELVSELKQLGILPEDATVRGFHSAFQRYLLELGFDLKWGQRSLAFALSSQHVAGRYQWCLKYQDILTSENLGDYWFCDEIVIEESGHPKGTGRCIHGVLNFAAAAPKLNQ